ncbi:hypothetical protein [Bacillus sp. FJAT-27445]|uniref:hypothetical protein n=1 Tax=Bacillus sp. FJAT-27445 TaxID=1679166 RepID=UPI0007432FA6|nr:hypothetical protein [Bacillus sp. FJAT-27445]
MVSLCKDCSSIVSLLNNKSVFLPRNEWEQLNHFHLIKYFADDNGVSEGSDFYICKKCYRTFKMYIHISFNNKVELLAVESVTEKELEMIAIALIMDNQALMIKEKLRNVEKIKVYRFSDLYRPQTFFFGTPYETRMYNFEILQNYGVNHARFSDFSGVYLSLDDLYQNLGCNDAYFEKTFIVSFEVSPRYLEIEASTSVYSSSKIWITPTRKIPPQDILLYDIENNTFSPLINVSINDCASRDHASYLKMLRKKAGQYKEDEETSRKIIHNKMEEIRTFIRVKTI